MTNTEFSTEFDVLYNNITSNQAPGLNDYEKSVFINKAQLQIVSEYFSKRLDSNSEGGFDSSPKRQIDFSKIMEWSTLERITSNVAKFDPRSILFEMPEDALFPVDEQISLIDYNNNSYSQADVDTFYSVVPISYEDYTRLMAKPYKYPPKNQAWRLITKTITIPSSTETIITWTTNSASVNVTAEEKFIFSFSYSSYPQDTSPIKFVAVINGTEIQQYHENGYNVFEVDPSMTIEELLKQLENYFYDFKLDAYDVNLKTHVAEYWRSGILFTTTCNGSTSTSEEKTTTKKQVLVLEVIGKFPTTPYYRMRYVRKPKSVILSDLPNGITIDTESTTQSCELPEEIHHEILERAVTLAKIAWQGATMTQTALAIQSGK